LARKRKIELIDKRGEKLRGVLTQMGTERRKEFWRGGGHENGKEGLTYGGRKAVTF